MIFTRRFGALAARPQFPDAPKLQQDVDMIAELERELARTAKVTTVADDADSKNESAA